MGFEWIISVITYLGVIAGAVLFLLVQLPGLRLVGARYILGVERRMRNVEPRERSTLFYILRSTLYVPGLGRVGKLLAPRLFGQAAWQVSCQVDESVEIVPHPHTSPPSPEMRQSKQWVSAR